MGLFRLLTELIKYKQILFIHFIVLLSFPGFPEWKEEGDKASIFFFVCVCLYSNIKKLVILIISKAVPSPLLSISS